MSLGLGFGGLRIPNPFFGVSVAMFLMKYKMKILQDKLILHACNYQDIKVHYMKSNTMFLSIIVTSGCVISVY